MNLQSDFISDAEPRMAAFFATLNTPELTRRLLFHEDCASDHRAEWFVRETSHTAMRLIRAELSSRAPADGSDRAA